MFEAKLAQCAVFKRLVDSMHSLIEEGNLDCNEEGISMQAMDTSHISLVAFMLRSEAFSEYRCDRALSLGIKLGSLTKILKCASNDDTATLKAHDEGADTADFTFESAKQDRVSDFQLKLLDIDSEHLGIPACDYDAAVTMPSAEFRRIVGDLAVLGETVKIDVSKSGATFSVEGDIGKGSITVHQTPPAADGEKNSSVAIELTRPVSMTYALRYLNVFAKAAVLSPMVTLSLNTTAPMQVDFPLEDDAGYVRYFLAPKMADDEGEETQAKDEPEVSSAKDEQEVTQTKTEVKEEVKDEEDEIEMED